MNIPKFSLHHKPVIWILLALFVGIGIMNYFTISQREDPEFKISVALVITIWPGAGAEKVERLVTSKLEEKFAELSVVERLTSTTREMLSVIMVKVDYEADVDIAWQKLRNKIAEANPDLPSGIIGPDVMDDFGDVTAMIVSMSSESADPAELKFWAKELKTETRKVDSVGKVELIGEQQEAVYIEGPLESFTRYSFSPLVASKILDYQNVNMPAGYVRSDVRNYRLEVTGSFKLTEQIENAILDVSRKSGLPMKVKDVFSVRRTFKEPPLDFMMTDGLQSVGLDVRMKKGENLVEMGTAVRKVVEEFRERLPNNINLKLVHDQPHQVDRFIGAFMNNLFEGLLIVIFVMFLAMGIRAAGLIALSLPISIILTFALMPVMGVDLETVSIAAFIIALGMLVDNAIIVADNIDVHMRSNPNRVQACIEGAQELAIPALTGTLATVFAFVPLLLLGEESGDYIRAMPIVVSVSLLASLVLALTVVPIAAVMLLKPNQSSDTKEVPKESGFTRGYRAMMQWCLDHRKSVSLITLIVFCASLMLIPIVGFSFFPEAERDQFLIDVWLPEGSSLEHTTKIVREVEGLLKEEKQIDNWVTYVGKGGPRFYMTIKPEFNATNYAQFVVTTQDPLITRAMVRRLNVEAIKRISGARVLVSNLWMGVPIEAPIAIRVVGPDLYEMKKISLQIQDILRSISGTTHVRDNVGELIPSLKVNVDSEAAAMAGITNTEVALSLLTAYEGLPITSMREGEDEVPVYMRLQAEDRNIGNTLEGLEVPSQATGDKVPLSAFSSIETIWGPGVIKRHNDRRSIMALANVRGRLASDVMKDLKPHLAGLALPKGYAIEIDGEEKERKKNFSRLSMIFALIIALILLMLVIQFNSFKKSLVILASIPLAIIGAVVGLLVSQSSFGFMPFLGVISLAGIVIKNAVVWVEFVERATGRGERLRAAIIEAGVKRLRPIMLTAGTTIGGLIPLALFGGVLWRGMASAMIFGLALATVLTLVLIPVLFFAVFRVGYNFKQENGHS